MDDETQVRAATEVVEVLRCASSEARWSPVVGQETLALLEYRRLAGGGGAVVLREAVAVLERCVPPRSVTGTGTGLVIGYVQSGKTMSFTAVAALARDNGYRLVIVLTGVTTNLFEQSKARLQEDLRLDTRDDREWSHFSNPRVTPANRQSIYNALGPPPVPGTCGRTVLITVMKNCRHLENLRILLADMDLRDVPALVIDDEADQASLNSKVHNNGQSPTYSKVVSLRALLPHHTFLQYTATPQAPLLISIIDQLSPEFGVLLTPGNAYTGGQVFFEKRLDLVRTIPQNDIPTGSVPVVEPPDSLLEALRAFYIGVAVGLSGGDKGNRSMMVHPSKEIAGHADYARWVRATQREWQRTLGQGLTDSDCQDLIAEFAVAYNDLASTESSLPPFGDVVPLLGNAISTTIVTEMNSSKGKIEEPNWKRDYAHIAVGGEVLNRGVTIRGLTVTYMPRGRGVGNADTIQQRARWFGYKADYLGLCRVHLSADTRQAYSECVEHEESVRQELRAHFDDGESLRDWRRAFFLSPNLRPTRDEVVQRTYTRGGYSDRWFAPDMPHLPIDALATNEKTVSAFIGGLSLEPDTGHAARTEAQRHLVARAVSLASIHADLLERLRYGAPKDAQNLVGLLLQLRSFLDASPAPGAGDTRCAVYLMSRGRTRERELGNDGIQQLFQGPHPDSTGSIYPGDRAVRDLATLTVQVHWLRLRSKGMVVADRVPAVGAPW